ncbi:MAG TPA: chorismate mutase [Gemmatimonadaceae bacterium]|nr:chorismate mutase [Gemmatimonadaceae bacterium]
MTASSESARDPREELMECRNAIEVVDRRIVALLAQRVALALRAAKAKRSAGLPIVDPSREEEVLRVVLDAGAQESLPAAPLRDIFHHIVGLSRRVQEDAR